MNFQMGKIGCVNYAHFRKSGHKWWFKGWVKATFLGDMPWEQGDIRYIALQAGRYKIYRPEIVFDPPTESVI